MYPVKVGLLHNRSPKEVEKRKLRLACKMEIVSFYGGCCDALGNMTKKQNKALESKLRSSDPGAQIDVAQRAVGRRLFHGDSWDHSIRSPTRMLTSPREVILR